MSSRETAVREKTELRFMCLVLLLLLLPETRAHAQNLELKEVVLAPLPVDAREFAVSKSVVHGKIYVFGGAWGTKTRDNIFEYDVSSNSWNELPSKLPYPYYDYNAYAVEGSDGCLYFGPGLTSGEINDPRNYTRLLKFEPTSKICQEVEGFDSPRRSVAVERAKSGRLYFFGGWDGLSRIDVHEYDATSGKLTELTELTFGRASISAILANDGNIYLFGGNEIPTVIELFDTRKKQVVLKRAVLPSEAQRADRGPFVWNGDGKIIYLLMPGTGKLYVYDYDSDEIIDTGFKLSNPPRHGRLVYDNTSREVYLFVADPYSDYTTKLIKLSPAELATAQLAARRPAFTRGRGSMRKGMTYAGPSLGVSFLGTAPQFGGNFEYGIDSNVGVGGVIRYWNYSRDIDSSKYSYSNVLLAGQANYHFKTGMDKLDMYVGIILGYDKQSPRLKSGPRKQGIRVSGFVLTLHGAIRYFFEENMAFVARLGYGTFSYGALEVGLDFRL
jgi:hypothetical protein